MTPEVQLAVVTSVTSIITAVITAFTTIWQKNRNWKYQDRRKAHKQHPYGERRHEYLNGEDR